MTNKANSANTEQPMSSSEFQDLLERVRRESRQRYRHGLIRDAIRRHHFSSKQAATLVGLLTKTRLKKNAAESFYPKIVDKQNFGLVLSEFDDRGDREDVEEAVGWDD